ncbi:MAG: HEAT repeat domain-containing protein [Planctomycetota bacterium]|jgi:HEAT repeat protein
MEELTLDALLERIQSDDAEVRTQAWQAAGSVGAAAVKPLAKIVVESEAKVKALQEQGEKKEWPKPLEVGRAAKRAIWQIVRSAGAPGKGDAKAAVVEELVGLLGNDQPACIRREAIWMLSEIGGNETIEAFREIPGLLANKEIREDARCCAERIPTEAAVRGLGRALEAAPEDFRLALAQSLRIRGVEVDKERYPCQKLVPTKETNVKAVSP